jgi:hypothetical protein
MTIARPLSQSTALTVVDRDHFRRHIEIDPDTGCWNWTGTMRSGYGLTDYKGIQYYVHRVHWVAMRGEIDIDLEVDHLCRNRRCLNLRHLEPTTRKVNTLRGESFAAKNAVKTHCPAGHALDGDNLRIHIDGGRSCWTCNREKGRERYWTLSAAADALGVKTSAYRSEYGDSVVVARSILNDLGVTE